MVEIFYCKGLISSLKVLSAVITITIKYFFPQACHNCKRTYTFLLDELD